MRILHAIHSFLPESGGPAQGIRHLARAARSTGIYETEVVCLDTPGCLPGSDDGLPIHALGPGLGHYGYTRRLDRWLQGNLDRFDGVIVDGLWQYHGLATWRACRKRTPYAVFAHGMLDPWFKKKYPGKHVLKACYWKAAEHRLLRDARAVLFTAEIEARLAQKTFPRAQWTSVLVPFGTVEPAGNREEQIRQFYAVCPEVRSRAFLLFLGRLHEKKGCDLLIEAFASRAGFDATTDLVIAGPDEQGKQSELLALALRLGVGARVHFVGMLQGDAKWGAFKAAEVFVLPSHQENFGIAVAEALACGVPVLISNKVNIWREIVDDGVGLVDDDTLEGTMRLLEAWRRLPRTAREAMAEKCQASFKLRFDIQRAPKVLAGLFAKGPD